jgi:lysine 6-dehydrogenase
MAEEKRSGFNEKKGTPMKVIVLGAGLVGSAIALDLAAESRFEVAVADISPQSLDRLRSDPRIRCVQADLASEEQLRSLLKPFDLVIGAMPGHLGFRTLKTILEAGKNVVDISFFPEDPFELDALAHARGLTAIVDCGVAPGLGNVLLGSVQASLDKVTSFMCCVGGLPAVRRKPYEYAAVFSPIDVIEEYTRPARYIENGIPVIKPALTDVERMHFKGIGTLEAFNTDGLRTLADTLPAPNMKEKTLRYPGHADLMRIFRDTGYFSKDPIDVGGHPVRPIDLTAKLLFPAWKLGEGEEDLTVMKVVIEGERQGKNIRLTFDLLDRYDRATGTTSMARTTGYTCSVAARLVTDGIFRRKGICPPEYIGMDVKACDALFAGLKQRGIAFDEQ